MQEHNQVRTMLEYAKPSLKGIELSIVRPPVNAATFDIEPNIVQIVQNFVQFGSLVDEEPNTHIASFLEICDAFRNNNSSEGSI